MLRVPTADTNAVRAALSVHFVHFSDVHLVDNVTPELEGGTKLAAGHAAEVNAAREKVRK
jgi:hypothetical protein